MSDVLQSVLDALSAFSRAHPVVFGIAAVTLVASLGTLFVGGVKYWPEKHGGTVGRAEKPSSQQEQVVHQSPGSTNIQAGRDVVIQTTPPPREEREEQTRPIIPLTTLSDGQRFVIKKKLQAYSGNVVRLIVVGNDPKLLIVWEQLVDAFEGSGWSTQKVRIGMVTTVGPNFPNGAYLTSRNLASPIVEAVFSIFSGAGVALPLTPDAFAGPGSTGPPPDVVIVVH